MCNADMLPVNNVTGLGTYMLKSFKRAINQGKSATVATIDLHYALAELFNIVRCFFDFQLTKELPRKI